MKIYQSGTRPTSNSQSRLRQILERIANWRLDFYQGNQRQNKSSGQRFLVFLFLKNGYHDIILLYYINSIKYFDIFPINSLYFVLFLQFYIMRVSYQRPYRHPIRQLWRFDRCDVRSDEKCFLNFVSAMTIFQHQ